jgi:hypothetical protein
MLGLCNSVLDLSKIPTLMYNIEHSSVVVAIVVYIIYSAKKETQQHASFLKNYLEVKLSD